VVGCVCVCVCVRRERERESEHVSSTWKGLVDHLAFVKQNEWK